MKDEYDFTNAKRAYEVPHLAQLQAEQGIKTKQAIAVSIDSEIVSRFRELSHDWQNHINDALKEWLSEHAL